MSSGHISAARCSKFTHEGGKLVQGSMAVYSSPGINVPYRCETACAEELQLKTGL